MSDLGPADGSLTDGGSESFQLRRSIRAFLAFFYLFALLFAVTAVLSSKIQHDPLGVAVPVVWFALVAVQARWMFLRMPWRIRLEPNAVVFVALRGYRRQIPYEELASVSTPGWDFNHQTASWRSSEQRVRSLTAFNGWRRLLNEIEKRAPQARVD